MVMRAAILLLALGIYEEFDIAINVQSQTADHDTAMNGAVAG